MYLFIYICLYINLLINTICMSKIQNDISKEEF